MTKSKEKENKKKKRFINACVIGGTLVLGTIGTSLPFYFMEPKIYWENSKVAKGYDIFLDHGNHAHSQYDLRIGSFKQGKRYKQLDPSKPNLVAIDRGSDGSIERFSAYNLITIADGQATVNDSSLLELASQDRLEWILREVLAKKDSVGRTIKQILYFND